MKFKFLIFCALFLSCKVDKKSPPADKDTNLLTASEIEEIVDNWKKDSLGCLRLRDPKRMKKLTRQLELVGQDSIAALKYLGEPNGKYGQGTDRHFLYFLECGKGKTSYHNFYCHFSGDTIHSFTEAVF
jgi:hypothetical protein